MVLRDRNKAVKAFHHPVMSSLFKTGWTDLTQPLSHFTQSTSLRFCTNGTLHFYMIQWMPLWYGLPFICPQHVSLNINIIYKENKMYKTNTYIRDTSLYSHMSFIPCVLKSCRLWWNVVSSCFNMRIQRHVVCF